MFYSETFLLRQIDLLRIETLQIGHIATQLGKRYERIYLISKQNGLLFVNSLLVGTDLNKEVGTRNLTSGIAHLSPIVVIMTLTG